MAKIQTGFLGERGNIRTTLLNCSYSQASEVKRGKDKGLDSMTSFSMNTLIYAAKFWDKGRKFGLALDCFIKVYKSIYT